MLRTARQLSRKDNDAHSSPSDSAPLPAPEEAAQTHSLHATGFWRFGPNTADVRTGLNQSPGSSAEDSPSIGATGMTPTGVSERPDEFLVT